MNKNITRHYGNKKITALQGAPHITQSHCKSMNTNFTHTASYPCDCGAPANKRIEPSLQAAHPQPVEAVEKVPKGL
ncbi:hypothetical protein [Dissulfurispira sp.]|uniref:hypothetical protein n=1 Tax=Dissulfurispira sp. TaxID=2817609 RepID=UPI002FDB27EF